jgi:hypothetical protein
MRQDIRRSRGIHETIIYNDKYIFHQNRKLFSFISSAFTIKINIYCSPFSHILLRPI